MTNKVLQTIIKTHATAAMLVGIVGILGSAGAVRAASLSINPTPSTTDIWRTETGQSMPTGTAGYVDGRSSPPQGATHFSLVVLGPQVSLSLGARQVMATPPTRMCSGLARQKPPLNSQETFFATMPMRRAVVRRPPSVLSSRYPWRPQATLRSASRSGRPPAQCSSMAPPAPLGPMRRRSALALRLPPGPVRSHILA